MRQFVLKTLLSLMATGLFVGSAQAQRNLPNPTTIQVLPVIKPFIPASKQEADRLVEITKPGYYRTLYGAGKGSTEAKARQAAVSCDLFFCSITINLTNNGPLSCTKPRVTLAVEGAPPGSTLAFSKGALPIAYTQTASVNQPGWYTVTVTAPSGAEATASTEVTSLPIPETVLTNNGPLSCRVTSVTLTASTTGSSVNTYRFSAGATQVDNGNTATVTTAGIYSVTVTSAEACTNVTSTPVTVANNNSNNSQVLTDLYNSLNGPNWVNHNSWLSGCPCSWYGITCDQNDQIIAINLTNNKLIGSLPASLSALTSLRTLDLSRNQLSGPLPAVLGNLTHLQTLALSQNQFSSLPENFSALTELQSLDLNNNQLSGPVPASLSMLTNLQYLYMGGNQLSGTLPESLSALTELKEILMAHNQLTGTIPNSLSTLTGLQTIILSNNQLSGPIPESLGTLPQLRTISLGYNQLTGLIPAQLSALTQLRFLTLTGNFLSGPIPTELSRLADLESLYLNSNQLTGSIPVSLTALTKLKQVSLSENQLSGSIPADLGSLPTLQTLDLSSNQLRGCLPASLSALCTGNRSVNLANNPGLPGGGDFTAFCASGTGLCGPPPTLTNLSVTPASVCSGDLITVVATAGNIASGYAYTLTTGSTTTSGTGSTSALSLSITASGSGAQVATLTLRNSDGQTISETAPFAIKPSPVLSIAANPSLTLVSGSSALLTASGAESYRWTTGLTTPSISVSVAGPYSVTGVGSNGCSASANVTLLVNGPSCDSYLSRTQIDGLGSNTVNGVYAAGNTIYAATEGGLSISTDGGSTWINKTTANGLGSNTVNGVYAVGNMVYAATANGLSISSNGGTGWINRTTANGLGSNTVQGVYALDGTLYAATASGLSISTNEGTSFSNKSLGSGLISSDIYGVFATDNAIYTATKLGLSKAPDADSRFSTRISGRVVRGVYVQDNTVYAATERGLSISTDGGQNFATRTTTNGLGSNIVNGVYAIGNTVYAATGGGLSISTDGGQSFTNYATAQGLSDNTVNSIYADGRHVYAATQGGVSLCPGCDLTPILYLSPTTHYGNSSFTLVVDLVEINSLPTSGTVTVKITKDSQVKLSFDSNVKTMGTRSVQNSVWTFTDSDAHYYTLTSNQVIAGGDKLSFGLQGVVSPGGTNGVLGISSVVVNIQGERQKTNNIDSEKIDYFQQ